MRNNNMKVLGVSATLVVAALFSASAAASLSYSFSGSGQNVSGTSFSATGGTDNVTVTGWANVTSGALAKQEVDMYSGGLGVHSSGESTASPNHSTDNFGPEEMVLFSFASDIALSGLSIGWSYNDSDMTVLAYAGTTPPAPVLSGQTYGNLLSSGWTLISHLSNVSGVTAGNASTATASASFNTGTTPVYSSYWLVGAYNPLVGSSTGWTSPDYLKISGLTGHTKPSSGGGGSGHVPEPATYFLMGAGLLGMTYMRRRQTPVGSQGRGAYSLPC